MKKYMVRTESGTIVYATNSMIKAIGWVLQNCVAIDTENDVFALPSGEKISYVVND